MAAPAFKLNAKERTIISRKQAQELFKDFANTPWQSITLGGCAIGDGALSGMGLLLPNLAAMQCLQYVDISDCIASLDEDEALRSLSSLSSSIGQWKGLISVDVSFNALGTKGMAACEPLFKGQVSLQHIYFVQNGLAGESVRLLTSYFTPGPPTSLRTIHIHSNCLGSYGLKLLVPLLENSPQLRSLRLSSLRAKPDGTLAVISALKDASQLEELNLSDNDMNYQTAEQFATVLSSKSKMIKLELADADIEDDSLGLMLDALANSDCPLAHLDISGNELTEDSTAAIAEVISSKSETLQVLDVSSNELGDDGIRTIAAAISSSSVMLKNISVFCTESNTRALLELAAVIKPLSSLESFNIDGNYVTESTAARLSKIFGPILGPTSDMEEANESDQDAEQVELLLEKLEQAGGEVEVEARSATEIDQPVVRKQGWFSIFRRGQQANSECTASPRSVDTSPNSSENIVSQSEGVCGASQSTEVTAENSDQVEAAQESGPNSEPSENRAIEGFQEALPLIGCDEQEEIMSTSVASSIAPNASPSVAAGEPEPLSDLAVLESARSLKNSIESLGREVSEVKVELELSGTPSTRRRLNFTSSRLQGDDVRGGEDYLLVGDQVKPSACDFIVDCLGGLLVGIFVVVLVLAIAQSQEEKAFTYRPV